MLTAEGCRARRQRLAGLVGAGCDALVISDPQHLMYLANYYADPFLFRSVNSGAVLVIRPDGSATLVADKMVERFARLAHVDEILAPVWYDGKHTAPPRRPLLVDNVVQYLRENSTGPRFAVEASALPAGIVEGLRQQIPGATFQPLDAVLHSMKRQKDPDELDLIRQSIRAIEAGFRAARDHLHAGASELDAYHLIEHASRDALGMRMPVYGDFASGPNTETGGGPPTSRVINKGDIFLLDYSVVVFGYRGDFANGWIVDGRATEEQRRMHDASLDALSAAEELLRPGTPCREIDRAVRQSFASKGLETQFKSHSGHGLGLGHPDPPYLVPESDDELLVGDVVAVEPSQTVAGVGCIRTEHNYLITPTGYERLSHHELTVDRQG